MSARLALEIKPPTRVRQGMQKYTEGFHDRNTVMVYWSNYNIWKQCRAITCFISLWLSQKSFLQSVSLRELRSIQMVGSSTVFGMWKWMVFKKYFSCYCWPQKIAELLNLCYKVLFFKIMTDSSGRKQMQPQHWGEAWHIQAEDTRLIPLPVSNCSIWYTIHRQSHNLDR
jgi:hypothetical protein